MSEESLSPSATRHPPPALRESGESAACPREGGGRLGVVICDCGKAIARRLDTEFLRRQAAVLPDVLYTAREAYPCSKDGQARLRQAIRDQGLNRVLVAGCTPRLVEKLFREVGRAAGLDDACVEVTDIREQCAYVHHGDAQAATEKAHNLIEMGVERLAATSLPHVHTGRVVKSAMVMDGGLSGLTAALSLADEGINVTLVDASATLSTGPGGALGDLQPPLSSSPSDGEDRRGVGARRLIAERIEAVSRHPRIRTLLNARVTDVTGRPGDYEVRLTHGDQATTVGVGAIVVAADASPKAIGHERWYDRSRVKTQIEFEQELNAASQADGDLAVKDIVMILCAEEAGGGRCSRLCCLAGIRQAIRVKQIHPDAKVTVLFRNLYLGGSGDLHADELEQARRLGVTFFRYQQEQPPTIGNSRTQQATPADSRRGQVAGETVEVPDPLTGEPLRVPFDRVVLATPIEAPHLAGRLAALLHLPLDEHGFLVEPRVRLRPGRYVDDGVYVVSGVHQPVDTAEALLQEYATSARVARFLSQTEIRIEASVAEVDASLCTGDGHCVSVCPTAAITLVRSEPLQQARHPHARLLSLAQVEPLRCIGCGNCVVACPVKAISLPGWNDAAILVQISAALRRSDATNTRVVALACEWSAYAAADMAGARRKPYPADVRVIRMPCSARFDPNHILWAFINGARGVFLGACPAGECHYGAGNLYAKERVDTLRTQLAERGIDPDRLHLKFLHGDDGEGFARAITEFVESVNRQL